MKSHTKDSADRHERASDAKTMAFRLAASPMEEMERLERLKRADPESTANVVANGKLLLEYATKGELRAIQVYLEHINEV